jgi:hypothetical protein
VSISLVSRRIREKILAGDEPRWVTEHIRSAYIRQAILSCPPWVDLAELREIERRAQRISRLTGIKHVADHIVPLTHPRVCGLSVPWNFQVVPHAVNAAKSNHWCPEQTSIFDCLHAESSPQWTLF